MHFFPIEDRHAPCPPAGDAGFRPVRLLLRLGAAAAGLLSASAYSQSNYSAPYAFSTLAGFARGSADGTGSAARFYNPAGVAVDSGGNLYVADTENSTIRKITPAGVVTTVAGAAGQTGSSDGPGATARFSYPNGIAVDGAGNLYVADLGNDTIRRIVPTIAGGVTTWTVSTLAGVALKAGTADGAGQAARFYAPSSVAVGPGGSLYVADLGNDTIRRVTSSISGGRTVWTVSTIAGTAGEAGGGDGTDGAALFNEPSGVAVDGAGNIYVADLGNETIRRIVPTLTGGATSWVTKTIAGTKGSAGSADGIGTAALFRNPAGVALDSAGNAYVGDLGNNTIRKIVMSTSGGATPWTVSTIAGSPGVSGSADGTGGGALFFKPYGLATDSSGNVYVADSVNCVIRRISTAGLVKTVAGIASFGSADGTSATAQFDNPFGVAVDRLGDVFVGDTGNNTVREITSATSGGVTTWTVATIAGTAGQGGSKDGTGGGASFKGPSGLAVDGAGNLYVADTLNSTIREITPTTTGGVTTWAVATIAGTAGEPGSADGVGGAALFYEPTGIAIDAAGNLYVADPGNDTIRRLTPAASGGTTVWTVKTIAGSAGKSGTANGAGGTALFNGPFGLSVDGAGNVYVADTLNNAIRKVAPSTSGGATTWTVSTVAGTPGLSGSTDGAGSAARFNGPYGVAVDGIGNLYVADSLDNVIRGITPAGIVTTLAGKPGSTGAVDGTGSAARFNQPTGIAVDGSGGVYVADSFNNMIRKGALGEPSITSQPVSAVVAGGGDASFSVAASGVPAPTFQWQVSSNGGATWTALADGGVVSGSASATLILTGVSLGMSGYEYECVASNPLNSVTTDPAVLTVLPPQTSPSLEGEPASETVAAGGNAGFTAQASGNPTPAYQWEVSSNGGISWSALSDGGGVSGSSTAALSLSGVAAGLSGYQYECVVTNKWGAVTTTPALLTVLPVQTAPSLGAQPGPQTVGVGGNTSFTAVATGNPAPGYQWLISINGGASFSDLGDGNGVAGSATGTLRLTGVTIGMNGYEFECAVTNSAGSETTTPALLTVLPAMSAPSIVSQPAAETVAAGGNTNFAVVATGNPAPAYQWEVSTDGGASYSPLADGKGVAGSAAATLNLSGAALGMSGYLYECSISNGVGSATTNPVILTVLPAQTAPSLATQPVPATVAAGGNASFTAVATGNPSPAYQWEVSTNGGASYAPLADGGGVAGSAAATLNLSGVALGMSGNLYECLIANSAGMVATTPAALIVLLPNTAPSIATQPVSTTVAAGGNAGFTAQASGNPAPAYQWEESTDGGASWTLLNDGNGVAGSATPNLGLSGVAIVMSGYEFECVVENSAGSATTQPAVLTVLPAQTAPSIGFEPVPETVAAGGNTSFAVVATGNPTPSYQWEVSTNGGATYSPLADGNGVAGSAAAELSLSGIGSGINGDQYVCVVTNSAGSATTTPAALTVLAALAAPSIGFEPVPETVAAGGNASFAVVATGNPTPSYQWKVSTNGGATFSALSDGGGVAGSATATLNLTGVAIGLNGAQYVCVMANSAGSATTTPAVLTVLPAQTAPSISVEPVSTTVAAGGNTGFAVVATGNPTPTFQWMVSTNGGTSWTGLVDGGGVAGSETASLDLSGVAIGMNGSQYECVIANSLGSVTTTPAALTVLPAQTAPSIAFQPAPVTVAAGGNATFAVTAGGNPSPGFQWRVSTNGGGAWTNLADGGGIAGSESATLNLSGVAVGMSGYQYDCVIANSAGSATTTAAVLTVLPAQTAPFITSQPASASVLAGGNTGFTVAAGGNPAPAFQWRYSANGGSTWTVLADGNGVAGSATATLSLSGVAAALNAYQFECVVSNSIASATSAAAVLTVDSPPSIGGQPISTTVVAGGSASFSVAAAGIPAPTFQWQVSSDGGASFSALSDGKGISGSSTETLNLTNVAAALNGHVYECVVANGFGTATSVPATLSVDTPPAIGIPPATQAVNAGSNIVLSVSASGDSALTYQWYLNGAPISGATASTLSLKDVQAASDGSYTVAVTDVFGSTTTSQPATLTVDAAPAGGISGQPVSQSVTPGNTVVFTVTAGGTVSSSLARPAGQTAALTTGTTYQWQFNGANLTDGGSISGSTGPQLVITGATAANDGNYSCLVTTSSGAVQSNSAGLIVAPVTSPGYLVNISSRAFVGSGDSILIGGFFVGGSTSRTVLIQALGPALESQGVSGVLAHPALTIHNSSGAVIYSNTGWGSNPVLLKAAASAYANPVLSPDSADSEALLTLPPGGYTAEITGADGGTGVALCAIYQLP